MRTQFIARCGVVVVALMAGQAQAQDGAEGEMPAWMTKSPAHAFLAKTVGTFDVATEFWMAPGAEPQKGKGVAVREMIMNGFWMQESFRMDWQGMAFHGRLTLGYDTVREKLVNTWIDNTSPVMSVQYGEEAEDRTFVFTGEDPGHDGTLEEAKTVVKFASVDKWVVTFYSVKDDGEHIKMRLTYERRKAAGAADLSTPKGAVQAFIDSLAKKDAAALKGLFARGCEEEFKPLVDGTASAKMMAELQKMFAGATVTGTEMEGAGAAVHVKLPNHPRGKETLNVVKEGDVWKIAGF